MIGDRNKYIINWFSNFVPFETPLVHCGISYITNEHFYQANKCVRWDIENRQKIASLKTPREAKKMGRQVQLRDDWDVVKDNIMEAGLRHKFAVGTKQRELLNRTDGEIVESNNWHDNYWGDCVCNKCKDIRGENRLGKLLMKIRNEENGKTKL